MNLREEFADLLTEYLVIEEEIRMELDGAWNALGEMDAANESVETLMGRIQGLLRQLREKLIQLAGVEHRFYFPDRDQAEAIMKAKGEIELIQDFIIRLSTMLETLESKVQSVFGRAGRAVQSGLSHVLAWLKKASAQLFAILARLTSPKEWKLSGGIALPWLANANVEITFGP